MNTKGFILFVLYTRFLLAYLDAIQKRVENALRKNFVPNNPLLEGWYTVN